MLAGIRSDCNKNFELILLLNAVTYMAQHHYIVSLKRFFKKEKDIAIESQYTFSCYLEN
jgi:hypothetical protein